MSSVSLPDRDFRSSSDRILVQDPAFGIGGRAARAVEAHARAGNLPSLAAELVGRETELRAIGELLTTHRLVEIVGTGGIGKTAVATAIGRWLAERGRRHAGRRLAGQAGKRDHGGRGLLTR